MDFQVRCRRQVTVPYLGNKLSFKYRRNQANSQAFLKEIWQDMALIMEYEYLTIFAMVILSVTACRKESERQFLQNSSASHSPQY